MAQLQRNPMWLLPVSSLSPKVTLKEMQPAVKVIAISGENDVIALPEYARQYVEEAKARGIPALMVTLPGKGHEILNEPFVVNQVAEAVRE
jgi:hypothetical protein